MKTLNLIIFLCLMGLLSFTQNIQNPLEEYLSIYPIRYHDGMEVFLKFEQLDGDVTIQYNQKDVGQLTEQLITKDFFLIKDLALDADYELRLFMNKGGKQVLLNEDPIVFNSHFDDLIEVSTVLNMRLNAYVSKAEQKTPLDEYLTSVVDNETLYPEEVLSFAQQYYFEWNNTIGRDPDAFKIIFNNFIVKPTPGTPNCLCKYVLNHNRYANPNSGISGGSISPSASAFIEFQPEYIQLQTIDVGPAHFKYLKLEGQGGASKYQHSTLGIDNPDSYASPSYASMNYNFFCTNFALVPDRCKCVKYISLKYRYDAKMELHTPDLNYFWSDGREAGVEEFAVLVANNSLGTNVLDAGRAKVHNTCNSSWNLDWFSSLSNLATDAIYLTVSIINSQGGSLVIIGNQLQGLISDITNLASTPVVNVSGTCSDQTQTGTLLQGSTVYGLLPNDPTSFILSSYTYLGGRGYGKWDLYATTSSDFYLSSVILSGASRGVLNLNPAPWCCSDKLGQYVLVGAGDPPLTTNNLHYDVASHLGSFAPWNNVTYDPSTSLLQLPGNHLGYLVYNDPNDRCAITIPNGKTDAIGNYSQSNSDPIDVNQFPNPGNENSELQTNKDQVALLLFPSPTESTLNIRVYSPENQIIEIVVFDVNGKKVATPFVGEVPTGTTTIPWNVGSKIRSGLYLVNCTAENVILSSKKFIKK